MFHYAAMGDTQFFSNMMAFLPLESLGREMRRRNANRMTPFDCCEHMHPSLATSLKTFLIKNGLDLDRDATSMAAAPRKRVGRAVELGEIVGMETARDRISQAIRLNQANADVPIKPLLLEGPPGTGKSFLATCIACELDREVVEIKCQDVLSHRLGGTEAQIQAHFERAALARPKKGLVIINEFESLCPKPKETGEGWHATLRQRFLTLFDETIDPTSRYWGVHVVLTTNFVTNVDRAALSRSQRIHIPLPSASDLKLLFPKICRERVPELGIDSVNWGAIASLAKGQLSVRGIEDTIISVARKLLATNSLPQASTNDFEEAVYDVMVDITLEQLERADKVIRVEIPPKMTKGTEEIPISLSSCLARCGWRFSNTPWAVFRQVLTLSQVPRDARLILRDVQTGSAFSGRGCYRVLPHPLPSENPFNKYDVYVPCDARDGSRPMLRERPLCSSNPTVMLALRCSTGRRQPTSCPFTAHCQSSHQWRLF